jgi:hypothetical protein
MRTARTLGIIALLFGIGARAQVFEAADVHPITVAIDSVMRGGYLRNRRYELRNARMADLIGRLTASLWIRSPAARNGSIRIDST